MGLSRVRFTVRQMVVGVAALAILSYNVGIPTWDHLKGPLMTRVVLRGLDRPIQLGIVGRTSLGGFLESIDRASAGSVSIALDPSPLSDLGVSMKSPVFVETDRMPVGQLLDQALKPLGLSYYVADGVLIVTSFGDAQGVLRNNNQARRP